MAGLRSSWIYVIGVTDNPVKIGKANNMKGRLMSLQIGCPDPLIVHYTLGIEPSLAQPIETACHRELAAKHRRGEWFDVSAAEAIEVVKRLGAEARDEAGFRARWRGDLLDELRVNYAIDPNVRGALAHYRDRLQTPHGKLDVARMNAFILKRVGASSLTVFRMLVVERRDILDLSEGQPALRRNIEAALVRSLNALADFSAYQNEQQLLAAMTPDIRELHERRAAKRAAKAQRLAKAG